MSMPVDGTPEEDIQSKVDAENPNTVEPLEEEETEEPIKVTLVEEQHTTNALPPYMVPSTMGQAALLTSMQHNHAWNAPVPPPEAAERFEKICPGSFERMLRMAEKEQDNQIDINKKQIEIAKKTSEDQVILATRAQNFLANDTKRGHLLGAGISFFAMLGAGISAYCQQTAIGMAFLGVPLMTVAMAFINSHKERKSKDKVKEPDNGSESNN